MSTERPIHFSAGGEGRRAFLQQLGSAVLLSSMQGIPALAAQRFGPNDKIRIATIGMGIMGFNDVGTALKVPGVEWAAACDLYTGRLQRAREIGGKDLFTTRDYRVLLDRSDIDAVLIATSDHWHGRIAAEALEKGKAVYCEKPMVHKIEEGLPLIKTWQRSKKIMQVGSQRISSIAYAKAREYYRAGAIGQLTCIEANFDRQSALGAWEYTQPTDGSPATVDWDRYIAGMPPQPYDAKKFFWWRNYRAFGTGVAGDLFVHLLSGVHFITGSMGPSSIYSSGQIAYWKDGRDVPDVMTGIMNYPDTPEHPAFQLMLRVNFISAQGETGTVKLIGSEGVLEMGGEGFTIRHRKMPAAPGIGGWDALTTYPQAMQDELMKKYNERYPESAQKVTDAEPTVYRAPEGSDEHLAHFMNFFHGVRTGEAVVEDPVFGFRAAAPCLAANESYFQGKIIGWDPVHMRIK